MSNYCFNNTLITVLFLCSPVQSGATMGSQVPLQLGQRGEVQTTLNTYVLLAFLMLQLMGAELTGVSEASATNTTAGRTEEVCACEKRFVSKKHQKKKTCCKHIYLYGFTSLCCIMCLFRWLVWVKALWHTWHL